jgi:hypothetical protein
MKVSAFSICRNAVKFDYPIVEVIRSGLPIVDEFIVNVGQSDDGTLELIRSIGSEKIRIVESFWDDNLKKDGLLFSIKPTRRWPIAPAPGPCTCRPTRCCTKLTMKLSDGPCGTTCRIRQCWG